MEDLSHSSLNAYGQPSLAAVAKAGQEAINGASHTSGFAVVAKRVLGEIRAAMECEDYSIEDSEVFCWGEGYFTTHNNFDEVQQRDGSNTGNYFGISDGPNIIPVEDSATNEISYKLVHSISIIGKNSIQEEGAHNIVEEAHLPFDKRNFMVLASALEAFDSPRPVTSYVGSVYSLAEEFSKSRDRGTFKRYSADKMAQHLEAITTRMEYAIGPKGAGLNIQSCSAYVFDLNRDGILALRASHCLLDSLKSATFMGVGDFMSFRQLPGRVAMNDFDDEMHNGLFIAVALNDNDAAKFGHGKQIVYVPLVGNNYHFEIA